MRIRDVRDVREFAENHRESGLSEKFRSKVRSARDDRSLEFVENRGIPSHPWKTKKDVSRVFTRFSIKLDARARALSAREAEFSR